MNVFLWIVLSSLAMSLLAWSGLLVVFLRENILKRIIFPLVSFAAGTLLAGAMLHMIPEAIENSDFPQDIFLWVIVGFSLFFLLEQFIHWHHCHLPPSEHKKPVTYLILAADGVHNFIGGLAIGSAFVVDIRLGIITWFVAAMHEIPQELGDFGILIHGGWSKAKALVFNFLSALTIVLGGILAFFVSTQINIAFLLAFAAGNFIYIASSDLIPEIKHEKNAKRNFLHFFYFCLGILVIYLTTLIK